MTDARSRSAAAHDAAFGPDHRDARLTRVADENVNGEYGVLDGSNPRHLDGTAAAAPAVELAALHPRDAHEHARTGGRGGPTSFEVLEMPGLPDA